MLHYECLWFASDQTAPSYIYVLFKVLYKTVQTTFFVQHNGRACHNDHEARRKIHLSLHHGALQCKNYEAPLWRWTIIIKFYTVESTQNVQNYTLERSLYSVAAAPVSVQAMSWIRVYQQVVYSYHSSVDQGSCALLWVGTPVILTIYMSKRHVLTHIYIFAFLAEKPEPAVCTITAKMWFTQHFPHSYQPSNQ